MSANRPFSICSVIYILLCSRNSIFFLSKENCLRKTPDYFLIRFSWKLFVSTLVSTVTLMQMISKGIWFIWFIDRSCYIARRRTHHVSVSFVQHALLRPFVSVHLGNFGQILLFESGMDQTFGCNMPCNLHDVSQLKMLLGSQQSDKGIIVWEMFGCHEELRIVRVKSKIFWKFLIASLTFAS